MVSTTIDRVIRRGSRLLEYEEILRANGRNHIFMSMLWDHHTIVDSHKALQVPAEGPKVRAWQALSTAQRRAPDVNMSLPLLEPIIWINESVQRKPCIAEHVRRHTKNAENFVLAMYSSSYVGSFEGEIPSELTQNEDGYREFNLGRAGLWATVVSQALEIGREQIDIEWADGHTSYSCSCVKDGHSIDCQCTCSICQKARFCGCRGSCECPAICNCRCPHCHDVHFRPCIGQDCPNPAPLGGKGGILCWPCYERKRKNEPKRCPKPGCSGTVTRSRGGYCSNVCYMAETPVPRTCAEPGCPTLQPPGTSRVCNPHRRAWAKAKKSEAT